MHRRLTGILLTAVIFVGGTLQAKAAEQTGTIRVNMDHGINPVRGASVSLCYVGMPSEEGFRLSESFGGGFVRREDMQSPDLARWLTGGAVWEGNEKYLDENGCAVFTDLREGLYLLVQNETAEGFRPTNPFLIPVPNNGMWELTAFPKMQKILTESPQTGQHPAPVIGAMGLVLAGMGLVACWDKIRKNR